MRPTFLALLALGLVAATPDPKPTAYVVLWFDTEDYLLPASDDAAKHLADFLTREGIRATFKVVGEKARTLESRGRTDVIDALKKHEIGYHSNFHSVHPTPAQYLSTLGWEDGAAEFERREGPGWADVKRIFGQVPVTYGQPGSSWGPQTFPVMKKWGMPVYLDAGSHVHLGGKPHYFGGLLALYKLDHRPRVQLGGEADLAEGKAKFLKVREQVLKEGGGIVSIYYHPCEWVHKAFWDGVNFMGGLNPPREEWKLPPQKSPEETRVAYETFEAWVRFMKAQPDVKFIVASEAAKLWRDDARGRAFAPAEVREIAAAVADDVDWQRRGALTLAPSELFLLITAALAGTSTTLDDTPYGPATPGEPMTEPVGATWSQVKRTAADVDAFVRKHGRMPPTVWLGSAGVTPESWLRGIAKALPAALDGKPPESVDFTPARLATVRHVTEDSVKLWGWLFPKGFRAPALMALARLQAWTIKPALLHPE